MANKDKTKWNNKYTNTPKLLEDREPSIKLINLLKDVKGNYALDIACGAGKNSIFLAKNDFIVDSMDISDVALKNLAKKSYKNINTIQIDLEEEFSPKENFYNLIVQTNFLDRTIIPKMIKALKKDGILFIETYMEHESNEKTPSNPDFLLKKEELKNIFKDGFEILDYDEFDNEPFELYRMRKQSIIARKIF